MPWLEAERATLHGPFGNQQFNAASAVAAAAATAAAAAVAAA
eukprot:CAMPEP_0172755274 /NCGR_PEP_ID=MMETSP1074-20121228/159542_1 /TAXON_ID=2916 /ORGANISM="Ceratium fusus, Strain PA161109" /LENGTH=41 /DNA_ID= /DNA_START= /DNA_END= /DNA_ORIENTATION=